MLWMYQRVFFGPLSNPENKGLADLNTRELVCLMPIVVLCFWIGLYPRPVFRVLEKPVNYVVSKVDPGYAAVLTERGGRVEHGNYTVVDVGAAWYLGNNRQHRLGVRLENAFDEDYGSSLGRAFRDSDGSSYPYTNLGTPRTVHASYRFRF